MATRGFRFLNPDARSFLCFSTRGMVNLKSEDAHPNPLYSICITCRNANQTIGRSLTSVLRQLDDRFEVIIVDGGSTDGTVETIRRLEREYRKLTIICHPCSRGAGRDIAFRRSKGRYLIQQVDADVIYRPTFQLILAYYHSREKIFGKYSLQVPTAFLISSRDVMESIGGWPDLQFAEDLYVYVKLTRVCTFERKRSLEKVAVKEHVKIERRRLYRVNERAYLVWRDFHRYLPFAQAVELLRGSIREEGRSPVTKFGTVGMFFLGALGQYSKTRYKLSGDDMRLLVWTHAFVIALDRSPYVYDLLFERTKELFPQVQRFTPTG
jgi:glycosyltransferase involved in cell wall biosynthesis